MENNRESGPSLQRALGSPLNRRAVGQRVAERHAELDDIGALFGKSKDIFQRGIERGITSGDIRDDPKFAARTQLREAFGNARRAVVCRAHLCLEQLSRALDSLKPPSPAL